ncbi:MAG: MOP flippase family protein [archaeon]
MNDLKGKAVQGVKWNTIKSIVEFTLSPLTLAVLARILSPTEYGHIAIITILIGFSKQIAAMGFSQAIIQKDKVDNKDLHSVFWFEQILGILAFIIIFLSAGFISDFFNEPEVLNLIKVVSFVFLLEPIDLVFRSLLKKDLRFDILTKSIIVRLIFQKGTTILFAVLGFGALSYVLGTLIGITVLTIIMFAYFLKNNFWLPGFYFSLTRVKPYLKFGVFIAGKSVFNNLFNYLDEIFIGSLLGTETLGIYHFAKNIIKYIRRMLNKPVSEVVFPLLSKLTSNLNQFNNTYSKIIKLIALIAVPAHIGVAITSYLFIPVLFGEKWEAAIPIVSILAFWGMFKTLYSQIISSALYSFGNSDWIFYATAIDLPVRALIFYIGSFFGLEVIAVLLSSIALFKLIIYQYVLKLVSNIEVKDIFLKLKFIAFSSLIMGTSGILIGILLGNIFNLLFTLIVVIISGILIYWLIIYLLEKPFLQYSLGLIKQMRG